MKKIITVSLIILSIGTLWFYIKNPLTAKVIIKGHTIPVELAVTSEEKEKGLGYRDHLAADTGMLFIYDHEEQYRFWMKGMKFPLDFIWIRDNKIVDLTTNVSADSKQVYQPVINVNKILELNAGAIDKWNIAVGDEVIFVD